MNSNKLKNYWFKPVYSTAVGVLMLITGVSANASENHTINMLYENNSKMDIVVKGTVTDNKGLPLPGATIKVVGGTNSTSSDSNGAFSISVPENGSLSISYAGYTTQVIAVNGRNTLKVALVESDNKLEEVVVTALGINRVKKDLTYSTQTVDTKNLSKAPETNVANSLSGRVAGLDVVQSSSGVKSNTRIVLRGDRSFGNSEALIIVDGVPGNINNLNPDDIESMNVLKGSSAAALYGSDASNGAIIVTTKKGTSGKLSVSFGSSAQFDQAVKLRDYQNEYAQGSQAEYIASSEFAWGPKITGQTVANWSLDPADEKTYQLSAHPDNFETFFDTGIKLTNSLSLSGGGEKIRAYFSYSNINATGIVSNNTLNRNNFNFRVDGDLTSKLSFDARVNYIDDNEQNGVVSGDSFVSAFHQVVNVPTNIDMNYLKTHYQYTNSLFQLKQNYWYPSSNGGENPYWVKYNTYRYSKPNSIRGLASLTYKFLPNLSFMLRTGLTRNNSLGHEQRNNDTYVEAADGSFSNSSGVYNENNTDFLLSHNATISDFTINTIIGGNYRDRQNYSESASAGKLVNENVFTFENAVPGTLNPSYNFSHTRKESLYAGVDFGFKKYLFLSLTGRNDWSSTLPKENRSYQYGSAGLTAIISDMVKMPEAVSLVKLRASVAQTGIDAAAYQTLNYYSVLSGGGIARPTRLTALDLKPEITTAKEFGLDLGFLSNRISLEATYYSTTSKNQLISVATPPASGSSSKFINAGNIQNKGVELNLKADIIRSADFSWTTNINFAKNNNKVVEIAPGVSEYGLGGDFMLNNKIVVGRPLGEMYAKGFVRNDAGKIKVDDEGIPEITGGNTIYIGNSRPDWIGGWGNRFSYSDFSLSFLVSARVGGRVASLTEAALDGAGLTARTLENRDGFVVDGVNQGGSANTITITAEEYWQKLGGRNSPAGEVFNYSATNIRLREVVLTYNIPSRYIENSFVKGASISASGRNLLFFRNDAKGFDPESVVGTGVGQIGTESFNLPFTRTFGLNLNLTF